ncbi:MAG: Sir2 family NAD+-dependent deacetylase [Geminicoccaceae bacterium]
MDKWPGPGENIVVLTGAGISVESGLPTYRGAEGLWEGHRLEDVATPGAFMRDPALVQRFYNERRNALLAPGIMPNAAHLALAELERRWPGEVLIVTQNIDDLHERAGSTHLIHMHGELLKVRCTICEGSYERREDVGLDTRCSGCAGVGTLRPHVVWFGEMPLEMERIFRALQDCSLFVSIGTSGNVYPAAGFVAEVRAMGLAHTLEINLEPSNVHTAFAERRHGLASELVPAFVDGLLQRHGL